MTVWESDESVKLIIHVNIKSCPSVAAASSAVWPIGICIISCFLVFEAGCPINFTFPDFFLSSEWILFN